MRSRGELTARPPSFSMLCRSGRAIRSAGTRPKRKLAASATASAKASAMPSIPAVASRGTPAG